MSRDLYSILQVNRNAEVDEIKASYRRLARLLHPDKNLQDENATAKFQQLSDAYEILTDTDKRIAYDAENPLPKAKKSSNINRRSACDVGNPVPETKAGPNSKKKPQAKEPAAARKPLANLLHEVKNDELEILAQALKRLSLLEKHLEELREIRKQRTRREQSIVSIIDQRVRPVLHACLVEVEAREKATKTWAKIFANSDERKERQEMLERADAVEEHRRAAAAEFHKLRNILDDSRMQTSFVNGGIFLAIRQERELHTLVANWQKLAPDTVAVNMPGGFEFRGQTRLNDLTFLEIGSRRGMARQIRELLWRQMNDPEEQKIISCVVWEDERPVTPPNA